MRRWRVVVIDDNPEGSLEAVLLTPLVISQPLRSDVQSEQIRELLGKNLLNNYLALPEGELYATEADVNFQTFDFATRRAKCSPRRPIIESERDFARAWALLDEFVEEPPDIVFLDVMFDEKAIERPRIEAVIAELDRSDRIGKSAPPTIREVLTRGGLFLLAKLMKSRREVHRMPLVVLYSASRDVQTDFRPFEYATSGRFEVVDKILLRNSADRRKTVFRRRISDYMKERVVWPEEVRSVVKLLATSEAIGGDHDTLVRAFSHSVGSGWQFGSLFAADAVAFISAEPSRRSAVVEDLEQFIAPLIGDARSFVDLIEFSPVRLFTHQRWFTFSKRPSWLASRFGDESDCTGRIRVSRDQLDDRGFDEALEALDVTVGRLPSSLRHVLNAHLQQMPLDDVLGKRRRPKDIDTLVRNLSGFDVVLDLLLQECRMKFPALDVLRFLSEKLRNVVCENEDVASRRWDSKHGIDLYLAPSSSRMKEPLGSLLLAIADGIRKYAHSDNPTKVTRVGYDIVGPPTSFEITIHDDGPGFVGLRHYDPYVHTGDLSSALLAAKEWCEVEIHSGGLKRLPTAREFGASVSDVINGTKFVIRIPAVQQLPENACVPLLM